MTTGNKLLLIFATVLLLLGMALGMAIVGVVQALQ